MPSVKRYPFLRSHFKELCIKGGNAWCALAPWREFRISFSEKDFFSPLFHFRSYITEYLTCLSRINFTYSTLQQEHCFIRITPTTSIKDPKSTDKTHATMASKSGIGLSSKSTPRVPASIAWYYATALFAFTITVLHFAQPDLDFGYSVSVFLWPLAPVRVATPFSIAYLWVFMDLDTKQTGHQVTKLEDMLQSSNGITKFHTMLFTVSVCAFTISSDILLFCFNDMSMPEYYEKLPIYQAGNAEVELLWMGMTLICILGSIAVIGAAALPWVLILCYAKACRSLTKNPKGTDSRETEPTVHSSIPMKSHSNALGFQSSIPSPTSGSYRTLNSEAFDDEIDYSTEWTMVDKP